MTKRLERKVALVTGGGRGIGSAIAERLARDGALVVVHYGFDDAAAGATVGAIEHAGGQVFSIRAPLGRELTEVDQLLESLDAGLESRALEPKLDVLVLNAASGALGSILTTTPEQFDRLFDLNTRAPFFIIQKCLGRLRENDRIVSISSTVTRFALPDLTTYAMTKAAMNSLVLQLAKELGPQGITANSVSPGVIDTDINAAWLRGEANGAAQEFVKSLQAIGRIGRPADVADIVAFLASDDSRWVTGQCIDASGGTRI